MPNSEIVLDKSNSNIIGQLYALRAGMSVISENADKIKETESEIKTLNDNVKEAQRILDNMEAEVLRKQEYCNIELRRNCNGDYDSILNREIKREKKANFELSMIFIIFWAGLSLPCGGLCSYGLVMLLNNNSLGIVPIILAILLIIITYTIRYIIRTKKFRKKAEAETKVIIDNLNKAKKDFEGKKKNYLDKKEAFDDTKKEIPRAESERVQLIFELQKSSEEIIAFLNNMFGTLLSPADWGNIDLLIFYLQTGRAETMKEGLQLVDKQRQADNIVKAIHNATESISTEIRVGLKTLGIAVVNCFNEISRQMSEQHDETMNALSDISLKKKFLIDELKLNNALVSKANTRSDELKRDIDFIKQKVKQAF